MSLPLRQKRLAIVAAIIAGLVAATVTYLFSTRPSWRRYVIDVGKSLLNFVDGVVKRRQAIDQHRG